MGAEGWLVLMLAIAAVSLGVASLVMSGSDRVFMAATALVFAAVTVAVLWWTGD